MKVLTGKHGVKKAFGMLAFIGLSIEYRSWDVDKATFKMLCALLLSAMGRMQLSWTGYKNIVEEDTEHEEF